MSLQRRIYTGTMVWTTSGTFTSQPSVSNIPFRVGKVTFYMKGIDNNTNNYTGGIVVYHYDYAGSSLGSINTGEESWTISIAATQSDIASSLAFTCTTSISAVGSNENIPYLIEVESLYF